MFPQKTKCNSMTIIANTIQRSTCVKKRRVASIVLPVVSTKKTVRIAKQTSTNVSHVKQGSTPARKHRQVVPNAPRASTAGRTASNAAYARQQNTNRNQGYDRVAVTLATM